MQSYVKADPLYGDIGKAM